ncbi:hypothetical protein GH714_025403 [Hevea brasiliensis]|uniref:F-box domain-containing protein n=1 Tax=Hevea brasiliensis TaxID=3981 RepID=A0A6A6NIY7_HEVBR|nr:hypothetical protein GH714_025403 [Hevea brasiliensis]
MSELIEGLPDAIAIRCIARVPFYLHPKLELVSCSWRAAIRSPELFKARQEVGSAEDLLCVCAFDPENLWQLYDPLRDLWITLPVLPQKSDTFPTLVLSPLLENCGFTSCRKSISQAEMYDPEKDVWIPIPDLHRSHNSACSGLVIGGKVHILHKGLSTVQVLDNAGSGWMVEDTVGSKVQWQLFMGPCM